MTRFAAHPRALIIAAFALAGIGASTAFTVSGPNLEPAEQSSGALSKQRVIAFAGGPPERCVYAGPNRELCTWKLDDTPVAPPADSATQGANLLCELPIQPEPGFEGSCSAHGRSVVADLPSVSAGDTPDAMPKPTPPGSPVIELDNARLLLDLSRRLGDAPDVCHTGLQQQTCIWRLSAETVARTFAAARAGRPHELRCTLPLDGSDRAAGSCTVAPLL